MVLAPSAGHGRAAGNRYGIPVHPASPGRWSAGKPGRQKGSPMPSSDDTSLFSPGSWSENSRLAQVLRRETVGGALLLAAAVIALVWANSPWSAGYYAMLDFVAG